MQGVQKVRTLLSLGSLLSVVLLAASPSWGQATSGNASTTPAKRGTSVAVIDINYLFDHYDSFQKAMEEVQADIKSLETYLRDERQKLLKKAEQIKSISGNSPQYANLEEEIASTQTKLNLEAGRRRKAILDKEAKIYYNAYRQVERHITAFADRYGIDLVMRFQSEPMDLNERESVLKSINRMVVFQRNLNITEHILQELNRPRMSRKP
jgi:Skp family chaperone for outer membrane proteins